MRIARTRGIQKDHTEGGIPGNAAEQQLDISLDWTVPSQCPEVERDEREVVLTLRTCSHHPREPPAHSLGKEPSGAGRRRAGSEDGDFFGTEVILLCSGRCHVWHSTNTAIAAAPFPKTAVGKMRRKCLFLFPNMGKHQLPGMFSTCSLPPTSAALL